MKKAATLEQKPSGLLGNVKEDALYVTPWGKPVPCYVLTDYGEPPLFGAVIGKDAAKIKDDFDRKFSKGRKHNIAKPHEVDKVEKRWVFFWKPAESASRAPVVRDEAAYEAAQDERRKAWPVTVLAAITTGIESAKSREQLAAELRCKPKNLGLPDDGPLWPEGEGKPKPAYKFDFAGTVIHYRKRGDYTVFYRECGEQVEMVV